MTDPLDPRLHALRPDLADSRLHGRVEADRFVEGVPAQVGVGVAGLHRRPEPAAPLDSQLLSGETVTLFERRDGWAWVQNETDGYVGYLRETALGEAVHAPTHRVSALRTPLLPEPDIKAPPLDFLHLSGPVAVAGERGHFVERAQGGWIFADHLMPRVLHEADHVATALEFLGAPYVWGGRSSLGLDCSALVQLSLALVGRAVPRDTDQQAASDATGRRLPPDATPQRGDLIYWRGHVAIALDATRVVNATAAPLAVVVEPLAQLDARARADSPDGILLIRRPGL